MRLVRDGDDDDDDGEDAGLRVCYRETAEEIEKHARLSA